MRIFLLSPANLGGKRAEMLFSDRARSDLARALQEGRSATLGEVYSFVSGLYFRGKLAYSRAFVRCPSGFSGGCLVMVPGEGLVEAGTPISLTDLERSARVPVESPGFREALASAAGQVAERVDPACEVVLLGSFASNKYVGVLAGVFGDRLLAPVDFVGRGDMSRGGLMLRCVAAGQELDYAPIAALPRRGIRPPRLAPAARS